MNQEIKARRNARRRQEDRALNRVLLAFCIAIALELVLFLINRGTSSSLPVGLSFVVPAVAGLVAVYYLFQREFFVVCLTTAIGIFTMQMYRKFLSNHPFRIQCLFLLALAVLVGGIVVMRGAQQNGGSFRGVALFPKNTNYVLPYVSCLISIIFLCTTILMGGYLPYYLIMALVAWLLGTLVYFTIKLI